MTAEDKVLYQASLKHPDVEETIDLWFYRPVGFQLALLGRRLGWTPNQITVFSLFLGIGCGVLCYPTDLGVNLLAIGLLILADICDSADGQLARLTHQYSLVGRILDGVSGDVWFAAIYVGLCLRLEPEWGLWVWLLAILAGICHALQAMMADYYRQIHLLFAKGSSGSELDQSADVAQQYASVRFATEPFRKVCLWFYRNYTQLQERFTPQWQMLRQELKQSGISPAFAEAFRQQSRPLMPMANALTFNCRAITLFISLVVGMPWLYWATEVLLFSLLWAYMIHRHEAICRSMRQQFNNTRAAK